MKVESCFDAQYINSAAKGLSVSSKQKMFAECCDGRAWQNGGQR